MPNSEAVGGVGAGGRIASSKLTVEISTSAHSYVKQRLFLTH